MTENLNDSVLRAGAQIAGPKHHTGFKPYALVPKDTILQYLDEEPTIPTRLKATPVFHDAPSLIAYVKAYDCSPRIFADVEASKVVAILDYHTDGLTEVEARHCEHRATYQPKASEEWKVWIAKNGKPMGQTEFAEFIENNRPDFLTPDAARMLEVASSMEVTKGVQFKSAKRLSDGQVQFQYIEQIDGQAGMKGEMGIPQSFTVGLRPYLGCEKRAVEARFRYRLDGGDLKVWFDLFRPVEIQREAFDGILKRIADETGYPVALGIP